MQVWRAGIALLSAAGLATVEIMRRTGKSKDLCMARAGGFIQERVAGLVRDKAGPSRVPPPP
jgi:hypothetical protein